MVASRVVAQRSKAAKQRSRAGRIPWAVSSSRRCSRPLEKASLSMPSWLS
jgi:hypothetical protein